MTDDMVTIPKSTLKLFGVFIVGFALGGMIFSQIGSSTSDPGETQTARPFFSQYADEIGLDVAQFDECLDSGATMGEVANDTADARDAGVSGTPTFFVGNEDRGYLMVVGAQPFRVFQTIIEQELTGGEVNASRRVDVSTDDDPMLGSQDAPVTIIEFSDYQCPFCERFFQQTLPQLKSEYIDTGDVNFVYRDIPLEQLGHVSADEAAQAANCAGEQGKYWEMHDKLFEGQQDDWGYFVDQQTGYLPYQ